MEGDPEDFLPCHVVTFDRRRIRHPPMSGGWFPGPNRTDFPRRVVADRDDEIHLGGPGCREFVPALAPQTGRRHLQGFEQIQGEGMDLPFRMAAGAVPPEPPLPDVVQDRLGKNAPRRVAGAQEKDAVDPLRSHLTIPPSAYQHPTARQAASRIRLSGIASYVFPSLSMVRQEGSCPSKSQHDWHTFSPAMASGRRASRGNAL